MGKEVSLLVLIWVPVDCEAEHLIPSGQLFLVCGAFAQFSMELFLSSLLTFKLSLYVLPITPFFVIYFSDTCPGL